MLGGAPPSTGRVSPTTPTTPHIAPPPPRGARGGECPRVRTGAPPSSLQESRTMPTAVSTGRGLTCGAPTTPARYLRLRAQEKLASRVPPGLGGAGGGRTGPASHTWDRDAPTV